MKTMSRRWCLTILLALLASLLAACGGGSSGGAATSAPAGGGGGAATSAPAAGGGTASAGACSDAGKGQQITMWSPLTGPDGDEMTGLANKFSQENSLGIKVTHTAQPNYLQKLETSAAGNSLPDMTVIRAGDIGQEVARNVLKPMSDAALTEAGGADTLKGQFTEAVWLAGQVKDKRYTIPLDTHPLVLYYNKDMFQKAG
ncbi:MAG TPA: extracellular solute-binding protein, partial [Roseiflexaceae bacterium]